ncbi:hypothetical protein D3C85_726460 [compost metagenome]
MKCLFIGGHAAGKIINVLDGQPFIGLPEPIGAPARITDFDAAPRDMPYRHTEYARHIITDRRGERHTLYAEIGIVDPLIELMDFYASVHRPIIPITGNR